MSELLLCRTFPPMLGGIERYISELFNRAGLDIHAIAPRAEGYEPFDGRLRYRVTRYSYGSRWKHGKVPLISLGIRALAVALRERPRVVFSDQVQTAGVGVPLARLFGAAYVVFAYSFELSPKRLFRVKRWAFHSADAIIAISNFTRSALIDLYGVSPARVQLIRPGVDTEVFSPNGQVPKRSTLGLLPEDLVLLTVGRLERKHRYKGFDRVIRLLAALLPDIPRVRLLVVGEGDDRRYLEGLAQKLGVASRVRFTGPVSNDFLPLLYRNADLFVLPSGTPNEGPFQAEGYGIVFAEAAASGTPSVGYRVGGAVDAVKDGVSGILTDPDEFALAGAVRTLLLDPQRLKQLGSTARDHAVREFGWDRSASALVQLCKRLIRGCGNRVPPAFT